MKYNNKMIMKYIIDRAYDIITVQLIGAIIFVLIGLTVKFIGGDLYTNSRKLYYNAVDSENFFNVTMNNDIGSTVSDSLSETENDLSAPAEENNVIIPEEMTSEVVETTGVENGYIWPISGKITAFYGVQSSLFSGPDSSHTGIDIGADTGTPIKSISDGKVTFAGYSEGFGKYIIISHSDNISSLYAHCSELLYKKGDIVEKGDIIALVGATGKATGSHLHIELLVGNKSVDPLWLLPSIDNI